MCETALFAIHIIINLILLDWKKFWWQKKEMVRLPIAYSNFLSFTEPNKPHNHCKG